MTDLTLFEVGGREANRGSRGEGWPAHHGSTPTSASKRRSSASRSLTTARTERDQAMARVEQHAGEWSEYAYEWLRSYLRTHATFFPEEAWDAGLERPAEMRAFGPVLLRAQRAGLMVKSGEYRQRAFGHATPGAVWLSRIFEGAA